MNLKKLLMGAIVAAAMLASLLGTLFVAPPAAFAASAPQAVAANLHMQRATMAVSPNNLRTYRHGQTVALVYREVFYLQDHPRAGVIRFTFQGPYGALQPQQISVAPHQCVVVATQVRYVVVQHGKTYTAFVHVTQPHNMWLSVYARA